MPRPRGSVLLLRHCAELGRLTGAEGRNAAERLEVALGPELARILVGALSGDHRPPARFGFVV
jgi:hypothetical protein